MGKVLTEVHVNLAPAETLAAIEEWIDLNKCTIVRKTPLRVEVRTRRGLDPLLYWLLGLVGIMFYTIPGVLVFIFCRKGFVDIEIEPQDGGSIVRYRTVGQHGRESAQAIANKLVSLSTRGKNAVAGRV